MLKKIVRYGIAGSIGAFSNFTLFYALTYGLKVWYVFASIISFSIALIISFILQKFWVFNNREIGKIHSQFLSYLVIGSINLVCNTGIVYLLVEFLDFPKLFAQIIAALLVALESLYVYKKFIFIAAT